MIHFSKLIFFCTLVGLLAACSGRSNNSAKPTTAAETTLTPRESAKVANEIADPYGIAGTYTATNCNCEAVIVLVKEQEGYSYRMDSGIISTSGKAHVQNNKQESSIVFEGAGDDNQNLRAELIDGKLLISSEENNLKAYTHFKDCACKQIELAK